MDIANSFAVPFDEDDKDKDVWFLDHEYLECMYQVFIIISSPIRKIFMYVCV